MRQRVLKIHPDDNVIVALQDLPSGEHVLLDGQLYTVIFPVNAKHKFSATYLKRGDAVIMYGVLVGRAVQEIQRGELITPFNVKHAATLPELRTSNYRWTPPDVSKFAGRTFNGYHRTDGKVGIANYWLVFPLVFCENRNVDMVREALVSKLGYEKQKGYQLNVDKLIDKYRQGAAIDDLMREEIIVDEPKRGINRIFKNIDGIKFLTHEGGCGGTRQDSIVLCSLLAGYLNNANVAGATVLSLGCQNAQVQLLEAAIKKINPIFDKPLYIIGQQESKSEPEFIAEAVCKTFAGLVQANNIQRAPAPLSKLIVGLKCGGSDGFSGISANPVLGCFSDILTALKGSVVLAEFPELNGVEQNMVDRCTSLPIAEKFLFLMRSYAESATKSGSGFDQNPSPGNIKDGLITDAIKSAGAAKKGGSSPVEQVLDYAEQVAKPGLHLLCTPGNDVESTTGLAGSGCTIILFTTGLGTPTGNPVASTIKISSNTNLAQHMGDIIDFDTGTIITGEDSIEAKADELVDYVIKIASGEVIPHAVRLQHDDFIPWKRGVSL
ncbi:MAG: UxaA family hydrolase [Bacteroidota bacterium]